MGHAVSVPKVLCSRVPPTTGGAPQDRRSPPGCAPTPPVRPPREEIVLRRARMTKAAALLLAGSLALAACASDEKTGNNDSGSGNTDSGTASEDLKIGLAYDTGGRGDRSFNDSAYAGVQAAIEEHGGEVQDPSPNADASNRAELLTQLADDGYNPIIAVGFAYGQDVATVAAQYPDVTFAIVDSPAGDVPNLTGILFAEEQGSFLAGVAAALKTETDHIGFVGGVDTQLIHKFEAG